MGNTATLNGHRKGVVGVNINPTQEEILDVEKMESTITLDDSTKEKILSVHKKRITKREIGNANLKAKIESTELQQKLEAAKVGTLNNALLEQKKQILKLLNASFFGTIIFIFLMPLGLSFSTGYSIGTMSERFANSFTPAFLIGTFSTGLFEMLMINLVLSFAHKGANRAMYSSMIVIAIITGIEIYKRGIDSLALTDLARFVGNLFLVPTIKVVASKIRDAAENASKTKINKKNFDRLPEETQKFLIDLCLDLSEQQVKFNSIPEKVETFFDKNTGLTKTRKIKTTDFKINRPNFKEVSNANYITEHSLRKLCVKYGVYNTTCFRAIPSKGKGKGKKKNVNQNPNPEIKQSVNEHPENN